MSSDRFDLEKVEWTKTTWSDDPVKPGKMTGPQWIENNTTVPVWLSLTNLPVAVLPATAYHQLYEAAEAMAIELSARCSCPCLMPKDERCEACRLTDAYREETEG